MAYELSEQGRALTTGKSEKPIYYRRPNGWITWGDQLSGNKLRDFVYRGFQPLMEYGQVNEVGEPFIGILERGGAKEFPIEQIVTYRWYRKAPVKVNFPQLQGVKIREFRCPECDRQPFVELNGRGGISGLGRHLSIMHRWDRTSLQKYGEVVGIDFNAIDAVTEIITEWQDEKTAEEPPVDFDLETVALHDCPKCDWKPSPQKQNPAAALRMHLRGAHPEPVPV